MNDYTATFTYYNPQFVKETLWTLLVFLIVHAIGQWFIGRKWPATRDRQELEFRRSERWSFGTMLAIIFLAAWFIWIV